MHNLFALIVSLFLFAGFAFAYGTDAAYGQAEAYGPTQDYGQYGLYSTGGSWAFPSVNSSPFAQSAQGAEYTIRNNYIVDAQFPEEIVRVERAGYGYGPEYGYGTEPYGYGYPEAAPYASAQAPQNAQQGNPFGNRFAPQPGDQTAYALGNGYVSESYRAGERMNLPEQSFETRYASAPLYSEIDLVLYEDGQGFTVQEGESVFKNVFLKNESLEPFYVDEIRANKAGGAGKAFNVQVIGTLAAVLPGQQGGIKLAIEGLAVDADEVDEASITVIGHFPSLEQQAIGPKTFLVYVNAADKEPMLPTATGLFNAPARSARNAPPAAGTTAAPATPDEPLTVQASDVEIVNHSEAVRVADKAIVKVTLRNRTAAPLNVFLDVVSDKVDVRGQDIVLAANELKTVDLEVTPLVDEALPFNAALMVRAAEGVETRRPVAFEIVKTAQPGMLPAAGELVKDGVTALASLGTTSWLVGIGIAILLGAFYLRSRDAEVVLDHQAQAWVTHKPRHGHAAH